MLCPGQEVWTWAEKEESEDGLGLGFRGGSVSPSHCPVCRKSGLPEQLSVRLVRLNADSQFTAGQNQQVKKQGNGDTLIGRPPAESRTFITTTAEGPRSGGT